MLFSIDRLIIGEIERSTEHEHLCQHLTYSVHRLVDSMQLNFDGHEEAYNSHDARKVNVKTYEKKDELFTLQRPVVSS